MVIQFIEVLQYIKMSYKCRGIKNSTPVRVHLENKLDNKTKEIELKKRRVKYILPSWIACRYKRYNFIIILIDYILNMHTLIKIVSSLQFYIQTI